MEKNRWSPSSNSVRVVVGRSGPTMTSWKPSRSRRTPNKRNANLSSKIGPVTEPETP